MKLFATAGKLDAPVLENEVTELSAEELRLVSGGIAESPPPVRDTLVRPGDTKGIAL